ncbi:hypothetical protein D3Z48_18460, partial [Clostridiaceae bacterium]|nr:hypothetical protein [Clostridiaceae bacterium]
AGGGALPLHPAPSPGGQPARLAAGLCPAPAGAFAPDPEMLRISSSPAGGTGAWPVLFAQWPARQNGGGLAEEGFVMGGVPFTARSPHPRWQNDASGDGALLVRKGSCGVHAGVCLMAEWG